MNTIEEESTVISDLEDTFTIKQAWGIYIHNFGSIYIHIWEILKSLYSQLRENPYS